MKDPAPLGFRVALNWGTATDLIHAGEPTGTGIGPEVWKVVQYASISWKVPGSEVLLEGGIFPCHVGAEAYFSKDNPHYTRSFVAEYTPWYSAGIKATAPLGKGFTGQLHVLNGWQIVGDNNDGKTIGAGLGWTPPKAVDVGAQRPRRPRAPRRQRALADVRRPRRHLARHAVAHAHRRARRREPEPARPRRGDLVGRLRLGESRPDGDDRDRVPRRAVLGPSRGDHGLRAEDLGRDGDARAPPAPAA